MHDSEVGHISLWLDGREFHQPRGPRGHSGEHAQAIQQVVYHEKFPVWLADAKTSIAQLQKGVKHHIAVVCKAGINRSVSLSRILSFCSSDKEEGCSTGLPLHMHYGQWKHRRICDGWCRHCTNHKMDAGKYLALQRALSLWKDI